MSASKAEDPGSNPGSGAKGNRMATAETALVQQDYCTIIAPVVEQAFERSGREWFLHTEVDEWLWEGQKRKPAVTIELVERNIAEFERHGGVSFVSTPLQTAGGLQLVRVAKLNPNQTLLFAILSRAPRAADVRTVVIRVVEQARTGALLATNQQTALLVGAVRELQAQMRGFQEQWQAFISTRRRDPSKATIERARAIVARYFGGHCPCCFDVLIVVDGQPTPDFTMDHWNGCHDARPEHVWPVCRVCNALLAGKPGFKADHVSEFVSYQRRREAGAHQLLLF
jgi:hypothetical protein